MNIFTILQPAASFLPFFSFFFCVYSPHSSAPCPSFRHWQCLVITKVKVTARLSGSFRRHKLCETSANVGARSIRRPGEDPGPCSLRKAWDRAKEGGAAERKKDVWRLQMRNWSDSKMWLQQMKQRSTGDWQWHSPARELSWLDYVPLFI